MKTSSPATSFLLLTFALSWGLIGIYRLAGGTTSYSVGVVILTIGYMFMPAVAALVTQKLIIREKPGTGLLLSFKINKWFLVAWLITPVISLATFGISLLLPDVVYSPDMAGMIKRFENILPPEQISKTVESMKSLPVHPVWLALLQGLIAGFTINAVAGLGEELGWRGFLLREFRHMHFWKAALLTGIIWGLWHAPLILMGHNYPEHPQLGVLMMTLFCILYSPLFLYITIKARSVIAAAILHGTLNGTAGIAIMLVDGGSDLTVGVTGMAGFIALAVVLIGLWIYDYWISREKLLVKVVHDSLGHVWNSDKSQYGYLLNEHPNLPIPSDIPREYNP